MKSIQTPVLFITYVRPDYARKVFNQIKKAKPAKLYFYNNKARIGNDDELERNNEIRSFVKEIDWVCDIKIFFRKEYVEIYTSLWSAFDWVFENEEQAIILEEDCVPSIAFFDYCEQLLTRYKDNKQIWLISGNNYIDDYNPNGNDYIFTRYPYQYGWAIWKDRWDKIEREDIPWPKMKKYELYRQLFPNKKEAEFQIKKENGIYKHLNEKPAWDYIMGITAKSYGAFGIVPNKNLVTNIGVMGAHNSKQSKFHNVESLNQDYFEINNHPLIIYPDYKYDRCFFEKVYGNELRLYFKIKKMFNTIITKFFNKTK